MFNQNDDFQRSRKHNELGVDPLSHDALLAHGTADEIDES